MNIKKEVCAWLKQYDWDVAVTLTFAHEYSEHQALAAARIFWKKVDYRLYKNASKRFNKRCERIMVLEGDGVGQHVHMHGAVVTPSDRFDDDLAFCSFLQKLWLKQNPRSIKVEFKPIWNAEGWSCYVTKQLSRFHCDRFDVHSSHIAAPNLLTAFNA